MAITVIETNAGYSIIVPFALKDIFKATFPSAKWDPASKSWGVGKRSGKKLTEWAEAAEPLLDKLKAIQEIEAAEIDLFAAKAQLSTMLDALDKRLSEKRPLSELLEELKSVEDKIAAVQAETKIAADILLEERSSIQKLLSRVIDFKAVNDARAKMATLHNQKGQREQFDKHQSVIKAQLDNLRNIGFTSAGLMHLSYASYNRPDRDKIYGDEVPDILDVKKLNSE